MPASQFAFRAQPYKSLYQAYFIASTLLCLPLWFATALLPATRPRRAWPVARAVLVWGIRGYVESWWAVGLPDVAGGGVGEGEDEGGEEAEAGKKETGFVRVGPVKAELVVGDVADLALKQGVAPGRTCGYWYQREAETGLKDRKAGPGEVVLLHFHGGGYITGSPHPDGGAIGPITSILLEQCKGISRVFAGGYRLSSSAPYPARNPFPAALLDALACYHHLIHVAGFRAENVIVGGDSAGGNLALALVRYVVANASRDSGLGLPVPRALLLLSPTVEWGVTHTGKDSSMERNARSDYCNVFFTGYTQRSLVGSLPLEISYTSPWISPGSLRLAEADVKGEFAGFPATYLCVGGAEICLDSYRTVRARLDAGIGAKAVYDEVADGTHDFLTMAWHEPERTESARRIGLWVDSL